MHWYGWSVFRFSCSVPTFYGVSVGSAPALNEQPTRWDSARRQVTLTLSVRRSVFVKFYEESLTKLFLLPLDFYLQYSSHSTTRSNKNPFRQHNPADININIQSRPVLVIQICGWGLREAGSVKQLAWDTYSQLLAQFCDRPSTPLETDYFYSTRFYRAALP